VLLFFLFRCKAGPDLGSSDRARRIGLERIVSWPGLLPKPILNDTIASQVKSG